MAFAGGLKQRVAQPRRGALRGVGCDPEFPRDAVGGLEADAVDVARELVGVGADFLNRLLAVGLVDAHCPARARPVGVQEHHDLAHDLLFRPGGLDPAAAFGADLVHFLQPCAVVVDDVEDALAELRHEFFRQHGADALDHAAAQVFFDALAGGGLTGFEAVGAELEAVLRVAHPFAAGREPFAAVDRRQRAEHGHEVALAAHLHAQDGETVLFVEKRDALDEAFDAFHGTAAVPPPNFLAAATRATLQSSMEPSSAPPADLLPARLARQIEFLMEIDKVKTVLRRNRVVSDPERRENDAEHMYHFRDHGDCARLSMPTNR